MRVIAASPSAGGTVFEYLTYLQKNYEKKQSIQWAACAITTRRKKQKHCAREIGVIATGRFIDGEKDFYGSQMATTRMAKTLYIDIVINWTWYGKECHLSLFISRLVRVNLNQFLIDKM